MHDLISIRDIEKKEILSILAESSNIEKNKKKYSLVLKDKIIANLFFEASTRTNLSFQAATALLGGRTLEFRPSTSSTVKGESFADTIKIIDGYADGIIIRHPLEGSARFAADLAEHPVINAGDGGNQHPTQTLIDLYTILKIKKKIEGLNITLLGDLKHARAMRSLLYGLAMFGANVTLVSPPSLSMDNDILLEVKEKFGITPESTSKIDLKDCDVVYICRIQKERFSDPYEAEKIQKEFRIDFETLKKAKEDIAILHPLPKVNELPYELDFDKRAKYFEQAKNGVPVRMAVLKHFIK
jgi:aspartate carbamoyltransferase catalytic subunit